MSAVANIEAERRWHKRMSSADHEIEALIRSARRGAYVGRRLMRHLQDMANSVADRAHAFGQAIILAIQQINRELSAASRQFAQINGD